MWLKIFMTTIYSALAILAVLILIALTFDLLTYLNFVKLYKNQGLKLTYFPILGAGYYFMPSKGNKDEFSNFSEFFKKCSEKIMFFNVPMSRTPAVYLTDPELIRQFLVVENDVSKNIALTQNSC